MSWYNAGAGAGVWTGVAWQNLIKNTVSQLARAINEREFALGMNRVGLAGIDDQGGGWAVVNILSHGMVVDDTFNVYGTGITEYDTEHVVSSVVDANHVGIVIPDTGAGDYTGSDAYAYKHTLTVPYNNDGDEKAYPSASDFVGLDISKRYTGQQRSVNAQTYTPTSLTSSITLATVTLTSTSGWTTGDWGEISGASPSTYNGRFQFTVSSSTLLTYIIPIPATSPATGTIVLSKLGRLTRVGSVATMHLPGHGYTERYVTEPGTKITISGATDSGWNGEFEVDTLIHVLPNVVSITRSGGTATVVFASNHGMLLNDVFIMEDCSEANYNKVGTVSSVPSSTSITYTVPTSGATPVSSGTATNLSVFQFNLPDGVEPETPASGDIKVVTARPMIYRATESGGVITYYCNGHDLATNDYAEIRVYEGNGDPTAYDEYGLYGKVTVTSNGFTMAAVDIPVWDTWRAGLRSTMTVTKEGPLRKLIRKLRSNVEALITATGTTSKFVEDDGTYATNWTLTNLLTEGSYGSTWIDMKYLKRTDVGKVLDQIREAVSLLVVIKTTLTITHFSNVYKIGNDVDSEVAWDECVADGEHSTSTHYVRVFARHFNSIPGPGTEYDLVIDDKMKASFDQRVGFGEFVSGGKIECSSYNATNSAGAPPVTAVASAFNVIDHMGSVFACDSANDTAETILICEDDETYWPSQPKVEFTIQYDGSYPSSIPFSHPNIVGDGDHTVYRQLTWLSYGSVVRRLNVGTHLTHG